MVIFLQLETYECLALLELNHLLLLSLWQFVLHDMCSIHIETASNDLNLYGSISV